MDDKNKLKIESEVLKKLLSLYHHQLIQRPGKKEEFEVSFKREKVQIKSVPYYGMLSNDVGILTE